MGTDSAGISDEVVVEVNDETVEQVVKGPDPAVWAERWQIVAGPPGSADND